MLIAKRIPLWYILRSVRWDIFYVSLLSVSTYFLFQFIDLPDMPIAIPALLGTAISLVLAFKLGHSYDRWWEARKIWGAIVNDSRTLILQAKNFNKWGAKDSSVLALANRQIAWPYALGQSLRGFSALEGQADRLSAEELSKLEKHSNVPLALLDLQSDCIKTMQADDKINDYQHVQMDKTLVRLCASMGQAERIKKTVFPTTYRIFLHFFIYIFVFMLAISMAETSGAWEIPRLLLITMPFFLLEKTAYYLQDPFENRETDTPVTSIARTIEININEMLGLENIPAPVTEEKYFVM